MKPQDFFLGVTEFFAILLPGAMFVGLFHEDSQIILVTAGISAQGASGWVAFVLAAYVAGHALHAAASPFDRLYDAIYARQRRANAGGDLLLDRARVLRNRALGTDSEITSVFSWARSYVRATNPSAASEIETRAAESKFFRSLSLVLFIAFLVFAWRGEAVVAVGTLLLMAFCFHRYCSRRWESTQLTYEYLVLLDTMGRPASGAGRTAAPAPTPSATPVVRTPIRRLGQR